MLWVKNRVLPLLRATGLRSRGREAQSEVPMDLLGAGLGRVSAPKEADRFSLLGTTETAKSGRRAENGVGGALAWGLKGQGGGSSSSRGES